MENNPFVMSEHFKVTSVISYFSLRRAFTEKDRWPIGRLL